MRRQAETFDLSQRASQAIDSLATEADVGQAADAAGGDRETIRGWLSQDPEFIAGLNRAKLERVERLRAEVRGLADEALSALRELICGAEVPPAVRLRAALAVLQTADATKVETIGPTSAAEIRSDLSRRELLASLG